MMRASLGLTHDTRSAWLRLRTLIVLRWFAIAGQLGAIAVAHQYLGLQIDLGMSLVAVGASVIFNLIAVFVFPANKRLSESEAVLTFLFDLAQLAFLLYLTGGLHNPFALLILAPVTISATALRLRSTLFLGAAAIALVTLLSFFYLPLRLATGEVLRSPAIFEFGSWFAIVIGVVFLGFYSRRVTTEIHSMADALLATQMALAREQKLTDLAGVVAAAAHELGTPLATIKLVSSEMVDELENPEQRADAELIRQQADRCRDILRSMGRAGKDDLHLRQAPLAAVISEAAEPHMDRGKQIHVQMAPGPGGDDRQPSIRRKPEIVHGLRNLIQNAVDFADANVWIDAEWTDGTITLRIVDDGEGFPPHLFGRIGDPFVRRRSGGADNPRRPGYEGMGLGLFIAKTLLERSGAELAFANAADPFLLASERPDRRGAVVEVSWPRDSIAADREEAIGANRPFTILS
ncbi:sensor histidine kinase RegB [Plastorhodobacter daqingensis]|uniref:histidine kinase n=1 Tax=Plastorhodobacter daqingensis TaxID=1387281 RepID=A0ABW2UF19_9RHOB